jgi:glutaredoxin
MSSPPPLTPAEARKSWQADPDVVRRKSIELASIANERNPNHGPSLILYSADWCGYCKLAKRHLDGAGYAYEERDVDRPAIAQELREKTGRGGVPVLDADGEILRGYSKDQYERFLREI